MLSAAAFPPAKYKATPAFGQRRAIALNLIVFFFFALTALVFLTRAAVAANAINRDVANAIEPATIGINDSTSKLPLLDKTMQITGEIAKATVPLAGHLDGVVSSTNQINANSASTLTSVLEIGSSVEEIKTSTGNIKPAIGTLGGHVGSIDSQAGDIASRYETVAGQTGSMVRNLTGTNASLSYVFTATKPLKKSVDGIDGTVGLIKGHTRSIDDSPILLNKGLNLTSLLQSLSVTDILGGK